MTPTTCHRSHQQQKKVVLFFRIKRVCNHKIRCGGCLEQFKTLRHKAAVKQDKALNRFFFFSLIWTAASPHTNKHTNEKKNSRQRLYTLSDVWLARRPRAHTEQESGRKKRHREESSKSVVKWISGKENKKTKKKGHLWFFFL